MAQRESPAVGDNGCEQNTDTADSCATRDQRKTLNRLVRSIVLSVVLAIFGAPAWAQRSSAASTAKSFNGYALTELSAPGLLYDPKAKATYYKALGPLSKEPWLAKLDGPSPQNRSVKVAGTDYVLLAACKNHDCAQNTAVLLYSGAQDVVYGTVHLRGKPTLIGSPSPTMAAELEKLWQREWRSQAK